VTVSVGRFVDLCMAQVGDKYIFAAEASRTDPNPEAFDCSELVEWALERLGVKDFPDGSMNQRAHCSAVAIDLALRRRGALLFRDPSVTGVGHVAVSLGDGKRTVEARGSAYGVGVFDADPHARLWTSAGLIPEVDYRAVDKPERVNRWVVFGRYGGRWGDSSTLTGCHGPIRKAEAQHGVAVLVHRLEPKELKGANNYPIWLAERQKRRVA
jgi:NlpC/P60 family protein